MLRLLLLVALIGCASSSEGPCPEFHRPVTPKDDLVGLWRYDAQVVEGPSSIRRELASIDALRWSLDEDFVYLHDADALDEETVALAFRIDVHLSVSVNGCLLTTAIRSTSRTASSPGLRWFEQSHAMVDWSTDYVARAPEGVVEWDLLRPSDPSTTPASFLFDETGALQQVMTRTQYIVRRCDTCDVEFATVEHVLSRESF